MRREHHREKYLTETELRALFLALDEEPSQVAAGVIALLAATGARKGEALAARWEHIDFERRLWVVPLSKSGRRRHIPLSDLALRILNRQRRLPNCPWVFPGKDPDRHVEGVRKAWDRVKARAGLPPDLRIHDLRHTFASTLVSKGRTLHEVDLLALQEAGYAIETLPDEEPGLVRKRLRDGRIAIAPTCTPAELAACRAALGALRQTAAPAVAAAFELVVDRLESAQTAAAAVDAAALAKAQGFVPRSGPVATVKPAVLEAIQAAILACRRITVTYRKGGTEPPRDYEAEPYGLLYGARNYLVWRGCEDGKFRKFALPYIDDVQVGDAVFTMDADFDIAGFAERATGVVLEQEEDIEILIAPEGKHRLSTWRFHPRQIVEQREDGSAIVRFRAASTEELAWDILRWTGFARVVHPPSLEAARKGLVCALAQAQDSP